MKKKSKFKKANKIFAGLIILEIILIIIFSFIKVYWPNPCVLPDFFHPFGTEIPSGTMCTQILTPGYLPILFLAQYALILTIITYLIYLLIKKIKKYE